MTIIILICVSVCAGAQGADSLGGMVARRKAWPMRILDGALDLRDRIVKNDSLYISRVPQKIKLGLAVNCSGAEIEAKGAGLEAGDFRTMLSSEMKTTMSVNVAYRGLGIGLKANPAKIFGKKASTELNMSFYGNRIGIDAVYQSSGNYKGNILSAGEKVYVPAGMVNMEMFMVNTYYAFNARRFSYPAAFTQSWIQHRSGGSILAGLSYSLGKLGAAADEELGNAPMTLRTSFGSIGVGYGYNFAMKKMWLLHLSAIPQVVVYSHNRLRIGDDSEKAPYRFPDVLMVGRISLVHHFGKYYVGMTGKVTTTTIGDRDRLLLNNVKWMGQVSFGIKLK